MHVCACVLTQSRLFAIPLTGVRQTPLSMEFSRQERWRGLPFPTPGDLPDPRMKPTRLASPALVAGFFTTTATWEPLLPYRLLRNREQRSLACTVLTPNLCPICSHNVCSSNVYYHREAIRGTHPQPCPGSTEPHPQDHQGSSWSPFLRNLSYLCLITPLC